MRRLGDDADGASGRRHAQAERDDGAVAVAPDDGPIDRQRVHQRQSFLSRPLMKVDALLVQDARSAITGAIRNHEAMRLLERRKLTVERVDVVAPATMKDYQRDAAAARTVIDRYGRNAGRQRRRRKGRV